MWRDNEIAFLLSCAHTFHLSAPSVMLMAARLLDATFVFQLKRGYDVIRAFVCLIQCKHWMSRVLMYVCTWYRTSGMHISHIQCRSLISSKEPYYRFCVFARHLCIESCLIIYCIFSSLTYRLHSNIIWQILLILFIGGSQTLGWVKIYSTIQKFVVGKILA